MNDLKSKCLDFLYKWVNDGKLAHLRKGMAEEFEAFVDHHMSEEKLRQISNDMQSKQRIVAAQEETKDETNPQ